MTVMQSVEHLRQVLVRNGLAHRTANRYVNSLVTHASVCRTRADAASGAFRDFVSMAGRMTRRDPALCDMGKSRKVYDGETEAACEALHDLIMEGVQ